MSHNPAVILYDANGNPVSVDQDGSVYRIRSLVKLDTGHGLATEAKQNSLLTELQAKADLTETQPVSAASLPLPAGASTEATVAGLLTDTQLRASPVPVTAHQGTKGSGSNAWPIGVYDTAGNAVDVFLDDDNHRRLRVEANFPPGQSIIIGNDLPADLGLIVRKYALNSGSSDLRVNGSVTPVEFSYPADSTYDIKVYEIRFLFSAQDIVFDGVSFGPLATLTNGILVKVDYNDGDTQELANITINEDLLMFPSPANAILNNTGPKDILVMGMFLGGGPKLKAGTSDKVYVTIRDNLTSNSINSLRAQVFGVKVS